MTSKMRWLAILVLYYGALTAAQVKTPGLLQWVPVTSGISSLHWIYVLAFFGFGIVLLGVVARTATGIGPTSWRLLSLVVGAGLALVNLWLGRVSTGSPLRIDMFLSALLGLALAVLLARLLPSRLVRHWQGQQP